MANVLTDVMTEIGTNMTNITTGNGFTQTVAVVVYDNLKDLTVLGRDSVNYPRVEVLAMELTTEDLSNEQQVITANFNINAYLLQSTYDDTLTERNVLLDFGADIRVSLLKAYARQQSGAFPSVNFRLINEIKQTFYSNETPDHLISVFNEISVQYDQDFNER